MLAWLYHWKILCGQTECMQQTLVSLFCEISVPCFVSVLYLWSTFEKKRGEKTGDMWYEKLPMYIFGNWESTSSSFLIFLGCAAAIEVWEFLDEMAQHLS